MCVWDEHLTTTIRREWRGRRMLVAEVKIHLVSWWTNYFLRFLSSSSHMVSFLGKFTLQDQREMTHLPFELVEGLKKESSFLHFPESTNECPWVWASGKPAGRFSSWLSWLLSGSCSQELRPENWFRGHRGKETQDAPASAGNSSSQENSVSTQ